MHVNTFTSHRWFAKDLDTGKSFLVNGEKQYIPRESHIDRRIHVAITVPSSWYFCRKNKLLCFKWPKVAVDDNNNDEDNDADDDNDTAAAAVDDDDDEQLLHYVSLKY